LVLVASGTRESHVCPFGSVQFYRSNDQGKTWLLPQTILDTPIDDRDAGILETDRGTLLATTFTSNAYVPILEKAQQDGSWEADRLKHWQAAHRRVTSEELKKMLGTWMVRSTDGGLTWSKPYDCHLNSPHGPIQLSNGNQLYAGKHLWREDGYIGSAISADDGKSWKPQARIPTREGDAPEKYHELHAVEAPSGKLIVHIRNHNPKHAGETLQSESSDSGVTWSVPHSIGVWGFPSHLLRLMDGRLLMSYGYRRGSMGNQARLSDDEGKTWSSPITLSDDAANYDLGYVTTVELAAGSFLSVWYEKLADSSKAVLRQTRWSFA
jgi:sialidase-1